MHKWMRVNRCRCVETSSTKCFVCFLRKKKLWTWEDDGREKPPNAMHIHNVVGGRGGRVRVRRMKGRVHLDERIHMVWFTKKITLALIGLHGYNYGLCGEHCLFNTGQSTEQSLPVWDSMLENISIPFPFASIHKCWFCSSTSSEISNPKFVEPFWEPRMADQK